MVNTHGVLQSLEQLDLSGVIEVVRRDAADRVGGRVVAVRDDPRHRPRRQPLYDFTQSFVFFHQQPNIVAPRAIPGWPNEPVRAPERKSFRAAARQPLPDDVLPVRRVDDDLPDVVPPATWSPRRLLRRHTAKRGVERRPVPGRTGDDRLDAMLTPIVRSAVELLTSDAAARIGRCADRGCAWLFFDTTRSGTRRWCDMKVCGNRNKVRRFRAG